MDLGLLHSLVQALSFQRAWAVMCARTPHCPFCWISFFASLKQEGFFSPVPYAGILLAAFCFFFP